MLAEIYGWDPAGTCFSSWYDEQFLRPESWDGGYCSSDMQEIRTADAEALADALERALQEIPDGDEEALMAAYDRALKVRSGEAAVMEAEPLVRGEKKEFLSLFSGSGKRAITGLVRFLREAVQNHWETTAVNIS